MATRYSSSSSNNNNSSNYYQSQHQLLFDKLKGLPFWIENEEEHRKQDAKVSDMCCWNHAVGLPRKDNQALRIFDYEVDLVKNLEENMSVWVKKSRGLGVTEIILRYISWICTRNDDYKCKRIHIVTGPRINLAEDLIDRIYNLFVDNNKTNPVELHQAGPIISLNNCTIQAFSSHTISSSRA